MRWFESPEVKPKSDHILQLTLKRHRSNSGSWGGGSSGNRAGSGSSGGTPTGLGTDLLSSSPPSVRSGSGSGSGGAFFKMRKFSIGAISPRIERLTPTAMTPPSSTEPRPTIERSPSGFSERGDGVESSSIPPQAITDVFKSLTIKFQSAKGKVYFSSPTWRVDYFCN